MLQIFGVSGPPQQVQRRRWMRHCVNRRMETFTISEPDTGHVRRQHAQHSRRTVRILHRFGHLGTGSHPTCRDPHPAHICHQTSSRGLHRRRTVDASSTTRRRRARPVAQHDTPKPFRALRRRRSSVLSAYTTALKSSQPPRRARSRRPGGGGGYLQRQTRSRTRCPYRCTRHGGGHVSTLTVSVTARAQMARPRRAWQQVGHPRLCGIDSRVTSQSRCARPGHPPRVRGTGLPRTRRLAPVGVIPACAGNRRRSQHGVRSVSLSGWGHETCRRRNPKQWRLGLSVGVSVLGVGAGVEVRWF